MPKAILESTAFDYNESVGNPTSLRFANLFLDPNNPRLGRDSLPGYEDLPHIFAEKTQREIESEIHNSTIANTEDLASSILGIGWSPADPIFVWAPKSARGNAIVLEGNTRIATLRKIHSDFKKLKIELDDKIAKRADKDVINELKDKIRQYEAVVARTESLEVKPVSVRNSNELQDILPRLLSVRHISGTRDWTPYATRLFILHEYKRQFVHAFGDVALKLDDGLITKVSGLVGQRPRDTKFDLQVALAWGRFKDKFESKLPKEKKKFDHEDQNYMAELIKHSYVRAQFKFPDNGKYLGEEEMDVLFKWAFEKYHKPGQENPNKLRIAEDFRLWQKLHRYDQSNKTDFASRMKVEDPENSPPIEEVEAEYLNHKGREDAVKVLDKLTTALNKLEFAKLDAEYETLSRMLDELQKTCRKQKAALEAVKNTD